jgi:hypothetical protein
LRIAVPIKRALNSDTIFPSKSSQNIAKAIEKAQTQKIRSTPETTFIQKSSK